MIGNFAQCEVLLALSDPWFEPEWLALVAAEMTASPVNWCRLPTGPDVVRRVERGGLSAALLVMDHAVNDGLSLLRIIRSIDRRLPCWFITPVASRQVLETALALSVTSVVTPPVEAAHIAYGLRRAMCPPLEGS